MGSEVHVHCAHWNQWVVCLLEQEKNTYVEQLLPTVKVIHMVYNIMKVLVLKKFENEMAKKLQVYLIRLKLS